MEQLIHRRVVSRHEGMASVRRMDRWYIEDRWKYDSSKLLAQGGRLLKEQAVDHLIPSRRSHPGDQAHIVEAVQKCSPTLSPSLLRPTSDIRVFLRSLYPGCFGFTSVPEAGSVLFGGCRKVSVLACNSDVDPMLEGSSSYTAVHLDTDTLGARDMYHLERSNLLLAFLRVQSRDLVVETKCL